jgi:hypothetical protein
MIWSNKEHHASLCCDAEDFCALCMCFQFVLEMQLRCLDLMLLHPLHFLLVVALFSQFQFAWKISFSALDFCLDFFGGTDYGICARLKFHKLVK